MSSTEIVITFLSLGSTKAQSVVPINSKVSNDRFPNRVEASRPNHTTQFQNGFDHNLFASPSETCTTKAVIPLPLENYFLPFR